MIVFLNGPFGVGKTTVAKLLAERIPDATLYDPEILGSILMRVLRPIKKVGDFQDYPLWRASVVEVARLLRRLRKRTLVIPMTVWRRDYFDQIASGLRRVDPNLRLFRLTASEETLVERILTRPDAEGDHEWRLGHLGVCLEASRNPAFGMEIRTDGLSPSEVADEISSVIGDGKREAENSHPAAGIGSWS